MKILRLFMVAVMALSFCMVQAQKKSQQPDKPKAEKPQPSPGDLLFANMLESTQRIFVIDSLVVVKNSFLSHIPLPSECGTLSTYDAFFNTEGHDDNYVFVNEFGNKAYFSLNEDNGKTSLYTMDKLAGKWSKPAKIEGISSNESPNFPFMMADGTTFYFAQKGDNAIGGYDIFVTRYDSDTGSFLRPNNIGLPFNSKANDYFYMESELDSIGWFVTDRNQPEGKVCIYTFIPPKSRKNIDFSNMSEERVMKYATIYSIRDTWTSEKERNNALRRVKNMEARAGGPQAEAGQEPFVINDKLVYTSSSQFRSEQARKAFTDLQQAYKRLTADTEQLEALRERYAQGDDAARRKLSAIILEAEKELENLFDKIKKQEKNVRNLENNALSN
ncbi:MAG: hypothetical protein IJ928_12445 [Prevotella sp.]|nr:hypothetical protein [Prevotella sp.]